MNFELPEKPTILRGLRMISVGAWLAKSGLSTMTAPEATMAEARELRCWKFLPVPYSPKPNRLGIAVLQGGSTTLKRLNCPTTGAAPLTTVSTTSVGL